MVSILYQQSKNALVVPLGSSEHQREDLWGKILTKQRYSFENYKQYPVTRNFAPQL